ncbi:ArdC family protein [Erwinia sp. OPT-41]|uniref:ArdC family protein n=1 Tax=Erwinia plantamica TaxID=3237104 RepID=A0ABW7CKZ8_9GAMM
MRKSTTKQHPAKSVDLYRKITDRIIIALENGVEPWRKPWRAVAGSELAGLPLNATTGRHYSGVNVLLLWMSAEEQGFRNNYWLTYRQAQQTGGQVRKGEKATLAVIYKDWTKQAEDREGNRLYDSEGRPLMETVPMLKPLQLFNAEQCEGLPADIAASPEQIQTMDEDGVLSPEVMDKVVRIFNATGVKHRMLPQDRAYYRPLTDEIVMPLAEQFFTEADWWSTLLHELVHSTGHARRLNREGITSSSRKFGGPVYAFEELIAEMGSAFLCAQLGVFGEVRHDSYVEGWLKVLKSDKKALFRACRQAREASEYLLALTGRNADAA